MRTTSAAPCGALVIARLSIALVAVGRRSLGGLRPLSPIDHLIAIAVLLGTLEGRPMTALKLSHFLGLPRATVIRRLARLCACAIVERQADGTYAAAPEHFDLDPGVNLILGAARELQSLGR